MRCPLTQGLRRRATAEAPIPRRRRGLDDRTDPGSLGVSAQRGFAPRSAAARPYGYEATLMPESLLSRGLTGRARLDNQQISANLRRRYGLGAVRSATHAREVSCRPADTVG
jgi:hypothetical protein